GGLLLRELEEVTAREYIAVVVAQALDRGQEPLPTLDRERSLFRILARRAGLRRRTQRQRGASAASTTAISGLIGDERQQPRKEGLAAAEAAECAVRLHERVLGRLLGVGRVACDHERRTEGERLVGDHERFESDRVAAARPLDERLLARYLHTPIVIVQ